MSRGIRFLSGCLIGLMLAAGCAAGDADEEAVEDMDGTAP